MRRGAVGPHQPIHAAGHVWACNDNSSSLPLFFFFFFHLSFFFFFSFFFAFYGAYPTECVAECEFRCRLWASLGLNPHKKGTKGLGEKHKALLLQALKR